jgi:uncharacterized protein DUF6378
MSEQPQNKSSGLVDIGSFIDWGKRLRRTAEYPDWEDKEVERIKNLLFPKSGPAPEEPKLWLDIAKEITSSDRQRDYGRPLKNFLRFCLKENIDHAGRRNRGDHITPLDTAHAMINLKSARDVNDFKADNWIDTMGYAATVNDMDNQMKELGYKDGVKAFKTMSVGDMFELLDSLVRSEADHGQGEFDLNAEIKAIGREREALLQTLGDLTSPTK